MKIVAHISDLHFGTEDPAIEAALFAELDGRDGPLPALVAVSGDLTQRARPEQFAAARSFLDRLRSPYLVVPGNHDIPLYDVVSRFLRPLARYRAMITDELYPTYVDDELAAIGVCTAYPFTAKDGRITEEHVETVCRKVGGVDRRWKVLVAHHPLVVPKGVSERDRADGADRALKRFEACGVDLILSGHLHVPYTTDLVGIRNDAHTVVSIHAGTCISRRLRGEPNGYNRLTFVDSELTIQHRVWNGTRFEDGPWKVYQRRPWEIERVAAGVAK